MFDFPSSPADGQIYGNYTYRNGVWMQEATSQPTAETRNRVCNPAMQISQENGTTAVGSTAYPVDQFIGLSALAACTFFKQATGSIKGNACLVTAVTTAKPSLVSTDYWQIAQYIEGTRIKDFQWGTAAAKQVVVRFWVLSNVTGTFSLFIKNHVPDRTFMAPFTITATSAWQEVVIVVPGETTGTWLSDTSKAMTFGIGLAAGSAVALGTAGWASINGGTQIPGQTNLAAGVNSFYLADVGLYLDPQTTGAAPPWQTPDEAQELVACKRYWQAVIAYMSGNVTAGQTYYASYPFPAAARPGYTLSGTNSAGGNFPASPGTLGLLSNNFAYESRVANGTGAGVFSSSIVVNGRM